ncbi:MAG: hypothetical protein ABR955_03565 [Verrucomicrobiota bacterium]|jgi:hypothetical protein
MSGKTTGLTTLETRKQQLLVESELNRAQLLNELRELKSEVRHLKPQVQAIGSMASAAAKLAGTFSHRDKDDKGHFWISTLLKGVQIGALFWRALRSGQR